MCIVIFMAVVIPVIREHGEEVGIRIIANCIVFGKVVYGELALIHSVTQNLTPGVSIAKNTGMSNKWWEVSLIILKSYRFGIFGCYCGCWWIIWEACSTVHNSFHDVDTAGSDVVEVVSTPFFTGTGADSSCRISCIGPDIKTYFFCIFICTSNRNPVPVAITSDIIGAGVNKSTFICTVFVAVLWFKNTIVVNWRIEHDVKLTVTINIGIIRVGFWEQIVFTSHGKHN